MSTEWLSIENLAGELGVPVKTVRTWRYQGTGPRGHTFGRSVRFARADVNAWIRSHADPADSLSRGKAG